MIATILSFFDWKIWFFILIGIILFLWVFWGGKNFKMVGLDPLDPRKNLKETIGSEEYKRRQEELTPDEGIVLGNAQGVHSDNLSQGNISSGSVNVDGIVKRLRNAESGDVNISVDTTPAVPREILDKIPPRLNINTNARRGRRSGHSKKEDLCRKILEEIYQKPFPSARPNWLRNPETGYPLEIDCYNDELKIGLEYNGIQHYTYPNFTGQTIEQFKSQLRRDIFKVDRCDQNNVYLITVPYNIPDHLIKDYIRYYLPEAAIQRMSS